MWSVDHGLEGFLAFALEGTSLLHNFSFCKSFSSSDSPEKTLPISYLKGIGQLLAF